MKYCIRCAREIGEGHAYCPHCGTPQKEVRVNKSEINKSSSQVKNRLISGISICFAILILIAAIAEKKGVFSVRNSQTQKSVFSYKPENTFSNPVVSVSANQILNEFKNNEIRAGEKYNGKRVRISGCVASVDNMMGILSIYINSCGGDFDLDYVHAQFPDNAKSRLTRLNKGERVVVDCTIVDGGDIMGVSGSNCILK